MSDVTLRSRTASRRRPGDAWEAVVREELSRLRRRSARTARVTPASRTRVQRDEAVPARRDAPA